MGACLLLAWLLATLVGPDVPQLSSSSSGDPDLIDTVERVAADRRSGHDALAVAFVDDDGVRFAQFGDRIDGEPVTESTAFEIGSLTKPLTGMVLADLIDEGAIDPGMTLGEITAPTAELDGDGADATLAALASHRAGYPRLPTSSIPASVLAQFTGGDPYTGSARDVLDSAAGTGETEGDYAYSNLGFAALGNGLAIDQGVTYAELLDERLLGPVGMAETVVADVAEQLPQARTDGSTAAGRDTENWLATGWQPAGIGTWSTTGDLALLAGAILDGDAPGMDALEPRFATDATDEDGRIGYGWQMRTPDEGVEIARHSGGTGGFRSWIGIDRSAGRAVVVLSDTTMPVDEFGEHILLDRGGGLPAESPSLFQWGAVLLMLVGTALPLFGVVRSSTPNNGDRQGLFRNVINAAVASLVLAVFVAWHLIPDAVWIVAISFALATAVVAGLTWSKVPTTESDRPALRWTATGFTVVINGAILALVVA